ncbi:AsnC family transcriptional regulator [Mycolicibacterium mageritense DSM 44476 = CIP 104973]|uniref:AsnC family transcriptional regulator n=1 Tax=Mycolicibacterium mageritense TaxID=53462 RepID=A0ABN5YJP9_MYCME|nr:Lrp/AsnC family transcriptional regulator [Mycolicibacterium mageritense]MBN3453775.1 Lrp/AsnC family transcriptional regulator [Mycobacterium sp. DSM 3803]OKH79068.1 transcriptional regulator [Mycobacterium sp. SWH-M3]MCC9181233.1 Lrp/AsnC family transcriptional regulator [Mycolicibacterium mageritense]CDO27065.1 AsnC family transcriptional regulator [Mycolicibacterium mageritense DSM 44476 = CIP 104973]BBX38201.1 AsnC family transcriptional regulator [Mycolicibacterium mageritense]
MDEVDEAIVGLLESDGRLTHRDVAHRVGLSRSAAAARMQRLIASGQVVVRGVVHPAVLGRGAVAHVSVMVDGSAAPIATALAQRVDVAFLSLTSGVYALIAEVRVGSMRDVDGVITELRAMSGVVGVDTLTYIEVLRDVVGPVGDVDVEVDEVDLALLRALQRDGRASYVDLAQAVGLSPAGARRRVVRLIESQVVRIGAVVRHSGQDRQSALGLGIRLTGTGDDVVTALAGMRSVIFLARTLGRFDLLATVRAFSAAQLVEILDAVRALPGVGVVDSWVHLDVVKESYASGLDAMVRPRRAR